MRRLREKSRNKGVEAEGGRCKTFIEGLYVTDP
jgi:hypothetical protein